MVICYARPGVPPRDSFDLVPRARRFTPTAAGAYVGADLAYVKLLDKLADKNFAGISPQLRDNILEYYKDRKAPPSPSNKKANDEWAKLAARLDRLRAVAATGQ